MKIIVRGRSKAISTEETRFAVDYMSSLLLSKQLCNKLYVIIEYKKYIDGSAEGRIEWLDDNHKPREFIIEILNSTTRKRQFEAMAHEITHMKQYARGEMKDMVRGRSRVKWQSKPIDNDVDYWFQPWEIEARGYERALTTWYYNHRKMLKKKFTK